MNKSKPSRLLQFIGISRWHLYGLAAVILLFYAFVAFAVVDDALGTGLLPESESSSDAAAVPCGEPLQPR